MSFLEKRKQSSRVMDLNVISVKKYLIESQICPDISWFILAKHKHVIVVKYLPVRLQWRNIESAMLIHWYLHAGTPIVEKFIVGDIVYNNMFAVTTETMFQTFLFLRYISHNARDHVPNISVEKVNFPLLGVHVLSSKHLCL